LLELQVKTQQTDGRTDRRTMRNA